MENYQEYWQQCLQLIRTYLPRDVKAIPQDDMGWVYQTWFAAVSFESFDPEKEMLVLRVPSAFVVEYIEHYHMPLWSWVLKTTFGPNVKLGYRNKSESSQPAGFLSSAISHERLRFKIPDARERLEQELRRAVGPGYQWLSYPSEHGPVGYDKIVSWLSDNEGRGLLFVGTPGVGKSVMCCDILPSIIGGKDKQRIPVVTAEQMLQRADELKRARVVVIDGLGREPRKRYGATDNTFLELCEASYQGGPLLIINTCLSTSPVSPQWRQDYPLSIEERYGSEVLDRLSVIARSVQFTGPSLRK